MAEQVAPQQQLARLHALVAACQRRLVDGRDLSSRAGNVELVGRAGPARRDGGEISGLRDGPHGKHNGVVGGGRALDRPHMAFHRLGPRDGQPRQFGRDPGGCVEHARFLRATMAAGEILEVVPDDQEPAPRVKRRHGLLEDTASSLRWQVQIEDDDEIKGGGRRSVLGQVRLHPFDLDARPLRDGGATFDSDAREVHRGDLPSLFCEPDGIAALAGTQVEGPACVQPTDLFDEELVRSFRPEESRASIARIPVVRFHLDHYCPAKGPPRRPAVPIRAGPSAESIRYGVGYFHPARRGRADGLASSSRS